MRKINIINSILALLVIGGTAYAAPSQKSLFSDNSIIIYGSQMPNTSKEETIIAFNLKKQMKSYINMWADNKVNENNLKRSNLIILGYDKSNNILNFTSQPFVKSNFPVDFREDSFAFGNKVYTGRNDGIAFIYPSPYNAKNYTLIYYSNSLGGLENLSKNIKMSVDNEYQIVSDKGIVREGKFNKDNFMWKFDPTMDNDYNSGSEE